MSMYLDNKKLCKLSGFTLSTMLTPEGWKSEGQQGLFVFVEIVILLSKTNTKHTNPYVWICCCHINYRCIHSVTQCKVIQDYFEKEFQDWHLFLQLEIPNPKLTILRESFV